VRAIRAQAVSNGATLIELLVVLVMIGIMAGVVGLTIHNAQPVPAVDPILAEIIAARDSAIRSGHTVTVHVDRAGSDRVETAYPDGRVIAEGSVGIDPLSGAINAAH
jgi:prepilin-type N-terminal cleavage/methylation domain-containing protein